jgi:uncharacterized CHY-type Zn-finger protein
MSRHGQNAEGDIVKAQIPLVCPACHANLNHHIPVDNAVAPVKGDIILCGECGKIMVFFTSTKLNVITIDQLSPTTQRRIAKALRLLTARTGRPQ